MDADDRARLRETVLQDATRPWSAFTVIDLLDHIDQLEAREQRVRDVIDHTATGGPWSKRPRVYADTIRAALDTTE